MGLVGEEWGENEEGEWMRGQFDEYGIRFRYPRDWELEVESDEFRTSVTLSAPDGLAFALVRLDEGCPDPEELAEEALDAIRAEYPELEASLATETIDGHEAVGYDGEFFSLDMVNGCAIRCFRTARRTVLVFGQWSEVEEDEPSELIRAIGRTIEETDGFVWPAGGGEEED